ncbi:MAG: hypothetical protein HQM14_15880 [SAR324 cluster bacterium]|nr:hypothetical protein [SAR324 cluster bacterium]
MTFPPISREQHLSRGYCCQNGCRLCPWDFGKYGNSPITDEEKRVYGLDEDSSESEIKR